MRRSELSCTVAIQGVCTPAGKDLVARMLTLDPKERITANEVLRHKWFQPLYARVSRRSGDESLKQGGTAAAGAGALASTQVLTVETSGSVFDIGNAGPTAGSAGTPYALGGPSSSMLVPAGSSLLPLQSPTASPTGGNALEASRTLDTNVCSAPQVTDAPALVAGVALSASAAAAAPDVGENLTAVAKPAGCSPVQDVASTATHEVHEDGSPSVREHDDDEEQADSGAKVKTKARGGKRGTTAGKAPVQRGSKRVKRGSTGTDE